jgi:hypothetical protein
MHGERLFIVFVVVSFYFEKGEIEICFQQNNG